ncbi:unnamed protein product [Adineta ricciae]|uniref:Uncharacterized protein n=1 Tax=Adineta ricciae TaxID=249248 RepID=A0A815LFH6_ADIRI|nr:unnamed protein product [Adineta ricciae]
MFISILTTIIVIGGLINESVGDTLSSSNYLIYCANESSMKVGNFTAMGIHPSYSDDPLQVWHTTIPEVMRLFRFIPVEEGGIPNNYRITSQFFGPTRSLVYDSDQNYLGFNRTNHTSTSQHWRVELTDGGNYMIYQAAKPHLYLTKSYEPYILTVAGTEYFCAWCLIEEGDFIGVKPAE